MSRTVHVALLQPDWKGNKGTMIGKRETQAREVVNREVEYRQSSIAVACPPLAHHCARFR